MKPESTYGRKRAWLIAAALFAAAQFASAQVTNWVAYNDHRPSTTPVASGWRSTATNVTGYDMGAPADLPASPLINFQTGSPLPATVSFTRTGGPDDFGAVGRPLLTNTPMARIFYGIVDLSNDGLIGVRAVPPNTAESYVTMTFSGLDPSKRYVLRGSVARNGGYGTRWSVSSISAAGWTDAHINGAGGPGVLTINNFPASGLKAGQAAYNSGANNEGAAVGWNDIVPFPDGTFSVTNQQYTGAIPGGTANGPYGYSFGAIMLAEVEIVAPTIVSNPVASITVEQNRPFSLSVAATGAPLNYQWYKGTAEIPGATFPTYSVAQAQVGDSGTYYAVVYNTLARRTSTVAQVTAFLDTNAPTVDAIFAYPTVDAGGAATLDQIIVDFSEPVTAASVGSASSYTVPGGGNPVSVIVTNERSVVLKLGTPLTENTDYSVTMTGATDLAGNVAGQRSAPFHSWVSSPGNGLLMESYPTEDPTLTVESLLTDSDFPNNPDRRDLMRVFDTRLVYPDDTREGYGARIRGVFIPPVSGNWVFFFRLPVFGVVYLNPNGISEAGKVEILRQSTQNAPYNWDRFSSSLYPLRAGQAYYIEGLYKAVTGADYFKVAARLAGTGVPTPVDTPDTQVDPNSLAGGFIAAPLGPRDLGGSLTIVRDLQDLTVEENHLAVFAPEVGNPSGLPLSYKWYRDDTEIPGATGPSYSLRVTGGDSGSVFRVDISKIGSFTNSRTANLIVVTDTHSPVLLTARPGDTNYNTVKLYFDELIDPAFANESGNFDIAGNTLQSSLDPDGSTVTLTLQTPLTPGATYQVQVSDVADLVGHPISPNPTILSFVASLEPPATNSPTLQVARSQNNVVLAWPASATGLTLQSTPVLPATNWTAVAAPVVVTNNLNTVTVPVQVGQYRFFRLIQ